MQLKSILLLSIAFIMGAYPSFCQQTDYNKIITPDNIEADEFGERLVQIAWRNYPSNKLLMKDYEIAQVSITQAKWSWLNQIGASGNLNEFTLNQEEEQNNFFPRYNFAITLPLGIIVDVPTNTKIAKKNLEKADLEIKQQKLVIRNQVLQAYQNLIMFEQILKIKSETAEDEQNTFLSIESSFEKGEATLNEYKEALSSYNSELEEEIKARNNYESAKLNIEFLIGVNLEEVIMTPSQ